ncbi:MAG: HAMP domain-containing histidine kinase [Clostridium sp.]|nr:HAMP domain-containing histidine kinase [Clostridium sp.]
MKHSIRGRFTMIFVGLMAAVLFTTWAVNSFFLEGFYTRQKLKILERAYGLINQLVVEKTNNGESLTEDLQSLYSADGEQTELSRMLRLMSEKYNTNIAIVDSMNDKPMPSARDARFLADRVHQYILGRNNLGTEVLVNEDNYKIQKSYDRHSQAYYLESWGFFEDNRTIFIMSMSIASIHDSVAVSNKFLAYVGLAALVAGSLLMYFTTKKVTSPIMSLASLSARMSELDFEARYEGRSEDEIGVLGRSMNTLSEKLEETIGELKIANNELQRDIEEKIRIDETRKDFIANVSHELKTPIALIQGYAEGLTEGMAEDPDSRDYYCEVIMDEVNKMNKMVKQFLNLTALEFGNDLPVMEQFDITALIRGILSSAGILLQQKETSVVFEQESPVLVWADEFKIEEVITNYLNNALNHLDGERRIEIWLEKRDKEVKVSVFNTGAPIPEEELNKLWTKFYKVDKAHTRSYGGSGIGLSIVKAIMDSHNKACGVENRPHGVVFWFTLDGDSN